MIIILKNVLQISDFTVRKIVPFIHYYRKQISSYNCTAHDILMNEISLILPNFPKGKTREEKVYLLC